MQRVIKLEEVDSNGFKVGFIDAIYRNGLLFLNQIRVNERVRGMGYGRNLLTRLLSLGASLGANRLEGNFRPDSGALSSARVFYQHMGISIYRGMLYKPL